MSVIYANNSHIIKRFLWDGLKRFKSIVNKDPWTLMGDFNIMLDPSESTSSSSGV